jgi:hypothetical protein
MLLALRIALTAGVTCQLFVGRRAAGVRRVLSAFKDHGSAAAAALVIIKSLLVMVATAAALSVVATVVVLAVAATVVALDGGGGGIGLVVEQTKLLLSVVRSIPTLLLVRCRCRRHCRHRSQHRRCI